MSDKMWHFVGAVAGLAILGLTFGFMVGPKAGIDISTGIAACIMGVIMGLACAVGRHEYGLKITATGAVAAVLAGGVAVANMMSVVASRATGIYMGMLTVLAACVAMCAYIAVRWAGRKARRIWRALHA